MDELVGQLEVGKRADVVLIKNDHSPTMFPMLNPYGHVALQASRGDVHTVLVDGRSSKHDGQAGRRTWRAPRREIDDTVELPAGRRSATRCGQQGMNPDVPETKVLDNPYMYTEFRTADTHRSGADRRGTAAVGSTR